MAYQKLVKRMLAGGLNLLYPGDSINDDEAQELTNFSFDSFGALRSRRGHALRYSLGGAAVSATRALGALWIAAAGAVHKDGAATIAGISADRAGLVGWKDFLWAMSEADQRKSSGSTDWKWLAEAPVAKPTIKPAATVETEVVSFTGGFTVDPSGDENYNQGFLQINAQAENEYTATKDIALDLYTGYSLDDVFKITVWCKQWKKVNGLTFQIDVNSGDFITDYYTAEMKQADIAAGKKEEVTFYLRKRPMGVDEAAKDKNRYGHFSRIGSTPEKDYRSCVKVRVKADFSDTTKLRFTSWKLIGDNSNTLEGDDFQVFYTYTTAAGHESNPSPASDPITLNRTGVVVSDMVASPDPQVTGQNIYLTGGTLGRVYRVNGITPVVGTTYTITASDDDLTGDNIQMEEDHEQPPEVGGLIGPYFGRLIAFGGSRYYWSHIDKPYAFAGPLLDDGDWSGVDEGVGSLLAATLRPGMLLLYGTNGVVVVQGDPGGNSSAVHTSAIEMGVQSSRAVVKTPAGDFAAMSEGAYLCSPDSAQLVSKKIEPVFKDGAFNFSNACVGHHNGTYYLSDGAVTYVWDSITDRWFKDTRLFSLFYVDQGVLLGVTTAGAVLELETGFNDAGGAFTVAWKSKAWGATTDNECTFEDVTVWADTGGATLTVTAIFNDGRSDEFSVALGTMNSTSEQRYVFQTDGSDGVIARNCAIRITGSVSAECVITKAVLNYYTEAREAKSFDSDERDDGTHKVKEVLKVYADLQNDGATNLIIQSDQPGFAMATRDSAHSFAAGATRRGEMYVLPTSVLAHNYRLLLNGDDFRLYGMRVLLQLIGTLIHGGKGEFYRSDPLNLGTERVKLYKEVHLAYASNASAELLVQTELPDGSIEDVKTFPLPSTGGIRLADVRTFNDLLPATAKGRLVSILITPDDDFRLEDLQIFAKAVGFPNATPWNWYPFPVEQTQPAVWQSVPVPVDEVG